MARYITGDGIRVEIGDQRNAIDRFPWTVATRHRCLASTTGTRPEAEEQAASVVEQWRRQGLGPRQEGDMAA